MKRFSWCGSEAFRNGAPERIAQHIHVLRRFATMLRMSKIVPDNFVERTRSPRQGAQW